MKFEVWMLRGLFVACLAVCALILGAMVTAVPLATPLAASGGIRTALLTAPGRCALPADGVVCPHRPG